MKGYLKRAVSVYLAILLAAAPVSTTVFASEEYLDDIYGTSWDAFVAENATEDSVASPASDYSHQDINITQSDEAVLLASQVSALSSSIVRYSVLVIDVSGSMRGTPLARTKQAAIKFCEQVLTEEGENYVAVISFNASAQTACSFSNDLTTLSTAINGFSANGSTSHHAGLSLADTLLKNIVDPNAIKNILILSDGLPESGASSSSGPYVASDYSYGYHYANSAYNLAQELKEFYNIYALGFFHSLSGQKLIFGRRLMDDLQNAGYYDVVNPDNLDFVFGEIADDLMKDFIQKDIRYNNPNSNDKIETVSVEWGPALFADSAANNQHTDKLALVAAGLTASIRRGSSSLLTEALGVLGFEKYEYNSAVLFGNENTYAISHRQMDIDGVDTTLIAIIFKGTEGIREPIGDALTKADKDFYGYKVHGYFLDFMQKVWDSLNNYAETQEIKSRKVKFLISGHSLGGAAANLLAAKMELINEKGTNEWHSNGWTVPVTRDDVYAFTFGALNTFDTYYSTTRFSNIFNIFNHYDTYGPYGDGSNAIGQEGGWFSVKPASGGAAMDFKFGSLLEFHQNYEGLFEKDKFCNHNMPGYVHAVKDGFVKFTTSSKKIRVVIACPVDVEVYDSSNQIIGKIEGNQIDSSLDQFSVFVENDTKYLLLPSEESFTLKITATDTGKMNFSVEPFGNSSNTQEAYRYFEGVDLASGKKMICNIGGDIEKSNVQLFVIDDQQKHTAEVQADGTEVPIISPIPLEAITFNKTSLSLKKGAKERLEVIYAPADTTEDKSVIWSSENSDIVEVTDGIVAAKAVGKTTIIAAVGEKMVSCTVTVTSSSERSSDRGSNSGSSSSVTNIGSNPTEEIPLADDSSAESPAENEAPELSSVFHDVSAQDWFYDDLTFVLENELFNGINETTFSPDNPMTRGMMVTVLHRLAGCPAVNDYDNPFSDVAVDAYYFDAVKWASQLGIIIGVGENKFVPDDTITRQDTAVIFARYAEKGKIILPHTEPETNFIDSTDIADYAADAVVNMQQTGIISGRPGNIFDPKDQVTRAEVAAILHRFVTAAK